jgi:hypothetical protein
VDPNLVRRVTEDLQNLLAAELLEWRCVTVGVTSRIMSLEEVQALESQSTPEDVKAEDQDGDLLISTYEADMMGSDFVAHLKVAGIRTVRSPTSSYTGEPAQKRPYLQPSSVPSLDSHLSIHSSALLSQSASTRSDRMSVAPSMSSRRSSDIFGHSRWLRMSRAEARLQDHVHPECSRLRRPRCGPLEAEVPQATCHTLVHPDW